MKKLKTLISVMLCAMLVLSLVVPSMAASAYSITIDGNEGQTYNAYKLFDVIYDAEDTTVNKKAVYKATSKVKTRIEALSVSGIEFEAINGDANNFYVTFTGDTEDARQKVAKDLANAMKAIPDATLTSTGASGWGFTKKTGTIPTNADADQEGTVTIDVGAPGYYFVTTTTGSVCNLTSATPTAEIYDKNEHTTVIKKIVEINDSRADENIVEIGDTVEFETIITIPVDSKSVVLHDKMEAGFTLNTGSIKVSIAAANYTIKIADFDDDCDFEIVFEEAYLNSLTSEAEVIVTYSAVLNENAEIRTADTDASNDNETWATYGANMKSNVAVTKTKTFDAYMFKYEGSDTPLAGAEFELRVGDVAVPLEKIDNVTYKVNKSSKNYTIVSVALPANNPTKEDSKIRIIGLDREKTYTLVETKVPDGYNKVSSDPNIIINDTVDILNNSGTLLPETGGMGTKVLFTVGGIMMVVAFVLITSKRRMAAEK